MSSKKPVTYRFFCSILIAVVLFGTAVPRGLQAKAWAQKMDDFFTSTLGVQAKASTCCCCSPAKKTLKSGQPKAGNKKNIRHDTSYQFKTTCMCCMGPVPLNSEATPALQFNAFQPVLLPIKEIRLKKYFSPGASLIEYLFLAASDSSPPIFLKNSSFLN